MTDIHAPIFTRKGTFGGTRAACSLDRILLEMNAEKQVYAKIQKWIDKLRYVVTNLQDNKNTTFRREVAKLYFVEIRRQIAASNLPGIVQSHLINHLTTMYRQFADKGLVPLTHLERIEQARLQNSSPQGLTIEQKSDILGR